MTRRLTLVDIQNLAAVGMAPDGEVLIRKVRNLHKNPFHFASQIYEPDVLDERLTDDRQNIKMGVELDEWEEPVAYHMLAKHPGETHFGVVQQGQKHIRVPADEIIHLFVIESIGQTRGLPWTVSALRRLHMAGKYEESALVAARMGGAKMGFIQSPQGFGFASNDKDAQGI